MKKILICVGGFLLGILSIVLGSYFFPIYKIKIQSTFWGPLIVIMSYFVFGLLPVTFYFKLLFKNSWPNALWKALKIVFGSLLLLGLITWILMSLTYHA